MKLRILILTFVIFSFYCCKQNEESLDSYQTNFEIGQIPKLNEFYNLNDYEKKMDSFSLAYDTLTALGKFKNNRSRVFINKYKNGELQKGDSLFPKGIPTKCSCQIKNDTIIINMGTGFFGGFGFSIELYKNSFRSIFFEYTDDVKPYKKDFNDTVFSSYIQVDNKYQMLILDEKPSKKQQQITGLLKYETKNYYERNYSGSIDTVYLKGKIYFTCEQIGNLPWEK